MKTILLLSVAVAMSGAMSAETYADPMMTTPHHRMLRSKHKVTANGRCNGVSYGTGQRSCGTATGGTPGGNPSRN